MRAEYDPKDIFDLISKVQNTQRSVRVSELSKKDFLVTRTVLQNIGIRFVCQKYNNKYNVTIIPTYELEPEGISSEDIDYLIDIEIEKEWDKELEREETEKTREEYEEYETDKYLDIMGKF